jgi:hypothetical protein
VALVAAALCLLVRARHNHDRAEDGLVSARTARSARLPLVFERNAGQTDPSVRYLSHNGRYSLFLTDDAAVFSMVAGTPHQDAPASGFAPRDPVVRSAVRLKLIGANSHPEIAGLDPLAGRVNYLIGKDATKWHVGIETYSRVRVSDIYPGVDIIYYGTPNSLEYDLVAAPGADTSSIKFAIEGPATTVVDGDGNLAIASAAGLMMIHKPLVYQQTRDGSRIPVGGRFELAGDQRIVGGVPHREVAIQLAAYDHSRSLVIDPTIDQVIYSSFLGGHASSVGNVNLEQFSGITQGQKIPAIADVGLDVALDPSNHSYVTGIAYSNDFPQVGGLGSGDTGANSPPNQNPVSFVSEFDTTQSNAASLIYSTYLGGSGDQNPADAGNGDGDLAFGIAVDASGQAYVVGQTYSTDFPDTASCGGFGRTSDQGETSTNVGFAAKLNSSGNGLVYSCYIDGSANATAARVALYPSGCGGNSCKAYVVGSTQSNQAEGFPVTTSNAFQGDLAATDGKSNAFFMVVHEDGQSLDYATYYGGAGNGQNAEAGLGVAVDSSAHGYITGATYSSPLPTQNPAVSAYAGGSNQTSNVFVAEFDPTQSGNHSLLYGTYLGGAGASVTIPVIGTFAIGDVGTGIAIDSENHIWVTGFTASSNFQVPGTSEPAYQSTNQAEAAQASAGAPATAAFITELDPTQSGLNQILYSTYFSGFGVFTTGLAIGQIGFGDAAVDIQVISGQSGDRVYITGAATSQSGFPLSPNACFPNNHSHGLPIGNALLTIDVPVTGFVSELDPTQSVAANQLVFSTYLGGSGQADAGAGIKVDSNGNLVVAGVTFSSDFPVTPNAFQVINNAASPNNTGPKSATNAFLTVLNPAGNTCPTPFPIASQTPTSTPTPKPTGTATPTSAATSTSAVTPIPATATQTPSITAVPTQTPTPVPVPALTPGGTLALSPTAISFGKVGTSTSTRQTLKIANSGQGKLYVYVDTSAMTSPPYSFVYSPPLLSGGLTIYVIPPNHDVLVTTRFAPGPQAVPQQSFPGKIVVNSGDPHHPKETVAVSGTGETGTLVVSAAPSLSVRHGRKKSATVTIRNAGLGVLHVTVDLTGLSAPLSATPTTGAFALAHNQTHALKVQFAPPTAGAFHGSIKIMSDDPAHPSVTLAVTATAT